MTTTPTTDARPLDERGLSRVEVERAYDSGAVRYVAHGSRYTASGGWEYVGALYCAWLPHRADVDPAAAADYVRSLRIHRGMPTYGDESVESVCSSV